MEQLLNNNENYAVIIPAYNEENTISKIVNKIIIRNIDVIVVDDGSIDKTAENAEKFGAIVIKHKRNFGYDKALETGLKKAIDNNYKYAITIDADGQHGDEIIDTVITMLDNSTELIVGKRNKNQRWSETIFRLIAKRKWGVDDILCGAKAYKLENVKKIKDFNNLNSIGTELTIRMIKLGSKIKEFEIETKPRLNGGSRFGNGIIANIKICIALTKCLLLIK